MATETGKQWAVLYWCARRQLRTKLLIYGRSRYFHGPKYLLQLLSAHVLQILTLFSCSCFLSLLALRLTAELRVAFIIPCCTQCYSHFMKVSSLQNLLTCEDCKNWNHYEMSWLHDVAWLRLAKGKLQCIRLAEFRHSVPQCPCDM